MRISAHVCRNMAPYPVLLLVAVALMSLTPVSCQSGNPSGRASTLREAASAVIAKVKRLEQNVEQLSRQLMLQQLFMEERVRSDGASGIKQARLRLQGTKPYHATTAIDARVTAIHEHANNIRGVGLGEFIAVLNGVEFRTRHNDYKVVQPATLEKPGPGNKILYDSVVDIPYPEVPKEVTAAGDLNAQIAEMRLWFKAFKDQDYSVRDYRKYFKPVLCYLEGGWTNTGKQIDESFASDRHFIDAKTWFELQDKVRFSSYSGRKDSSENYAYLPTAVMSVDNGTAVLAQWNYRIACHPLSKDLPTKRLRVIDDITSRMAFGKSLKEHELTRAARFRVANDDSGRDRFTRYEQLDELMGEIPGKDGYGAHLQDGGLDGKIAQKYQEAGELNAAYYHRWFKAKKDAMGTQSNHRAFADETLFMAMTTQEKIAPLAAERCSGNRKNRVCTTEKQRWTYAIPLEIIYLTPLYMWNPHGIKYKGHFRSSLGETVTAGGRNGRSAETAYDGNHNKIFYHTPIEFFKEIKDTGDSADTSGKSLWVLDEKKVAHHVAASGTRIFLPEIETVGRLRTRYPITPFHYEGSAAWKELTALKDLILQPERYAHLLYDKMTPGTKPTTLTFILTTSRNRDVEQHVHRITVPSEDLRKLATGVLRKLEVETDEVVGHTHMLTLKWNRSKKLPMYVMCGTTRQCWDRHPYLLRESSN